MMARPYFPRSLERGRALRALGLGAAFVVFLGIIRADDLLDIPSFMLAVVAALLPTFLWIRAGSSGIPILPAFALLHLFYFAIPIVSARDLLLESTRMDVLRAAGTVGLFLGAASLSSMWVAGRRRQSALLSQDVFSDKQMTSFLFVGLGLGICYFTALISGALNGIGTFFGLLRAIVSTTLVISCYFLGVARARGLLRGPRWATAVVGLCSVVALSWSSFLLVGGAAFILSAGLGYIITSKRIPWIAVAAVFVIVSILHAGKAEMRARYWEQGMNYGGVYSVTQLPGIAVEWVSAGLTGLTSGVDNSSAIDRTSLLPLLLRAQRLTPQYIDYLRGETYALLPGMLLPRFLSPEKTASQAGMDLLNIRYGILSAEGVQSTAVGWGLVAEAWANFGYRGEIGVGLLVGLVAGALTRWSAGASAVSRPTLLAIATMIALLNLEADLAGLLTSLFQSFAAVLIFLGVFTVLARPRKATSPARAPNLALPRRLS